MTFRNPSTARHSTKYYISLCVMWTVFIFASYFYFESVERKHTMALAENEARTLFKKDLAFRKWASSIGGCYVEASDRVPPSPYMSHIPERDITTPSGRKLTLMNPAYMLRSIFESQADMFGTPSKITGLKYLNPINTPDEWEKSAIHRFEAGESEVKDIVDVNGKPHLRLMSVMKMEDSCLKCHSILGYKVGEVRGGIGVNVSLVPYFEALKISTTSILYMHFGIWILGSGVIYLIFRRRLENDILRDQKEHLLEEAKQIAESTNQAKSEFMSKMSEEIKFPLHSILQLGDLLKSSQLSSDQTQIVNQLIVSSRSLFGIATNIVEMSDLVSGKLRLNKTEFSLIDLINEISTTYKPLIEAKGLNFQTVFTPGIPTQITGDSTRLKQILSNLLQSSIKYTNQGTITFRATVLDLKAMEFLFEVEDTGIGFSQKDINNLFSPFSPLDFSITQKYGGAGLGLSIAQNLAQMMSGRITISSEIDKGSLYTFIVKLG